MTRPISNIKADAIILLQGKNLKFVSPSLSKKAPPGATTTIVWEIHPPNHQAKISISLKPGSPNPFTKWPTGIATGNTITGTIDETKIPAKGYLEFEYSVKDEDNDTEIDPGGMVYR